MSFLSSLTLRQILTIDAVSSGAMAILLLAGGGLLEGLLGIPAGFLRGAGAILIPFAAFVGWLGSRPEPARTAVWIIVAANLLWVVESILVLFTGWFSPTALGLAFVIGQALFVAAMAELQIMALRRCPAAA